MRRTTEETITDMTRGLFITLEGGDGAGKSTQIRNIKEYFETKGYSCVITREPGGTAIGEKLRDILLYSSGKEMDPITEMLIFAAQRAQHVAEFVKPALERGDIVICDRYVDSSIAYQGYGRELGEKVAIVNGYATTGLKPDITFWMDLDPEQGRARVARAGELDRLEQEQLDFHYRLYDGYRALAEAEPERIKRIDASRSIDEIRDTIYSYLDNLVNKE